MNHEVTTRAGDDLRLLYQIPSRGLEQIAELDRVRRVMLGMGFPEKGYGYVVAVAERRWESDDDVACQFVILDEAEGQSARETLEMAVNLKDKYLATGMACPNEPTPFVEAVREHEGLSYYPDSNHPYEFRQRWPNYVSTRTTAYVNDMGIPDRETIKKEMDELWVQYVLHPVTKGEIFTEKGTAPLKKMVILESPPGANFSTTKAQQGIQTGDSSIRTPIWMAVTALQDSKWAAMPSTGGHEWVKGRAGY